MTEASPVGLSPSVSSSILRFVDAEVGREDDHEVELLVLEHLPGGGIVGDRCGRARCPGCPSSAVSSLETTSGAGRSREDSSTTATWAVLALLAAEHPAEQGDDRQRRDVAGAPAIGGRAGTGRRCGGRRRLHEARSSTGLLRAAAVAPLRRRRRRRLRRRSSGRPFRGCPCRPACRKLAAASPAPGRARPG